MTDDDQVTAESVVHAYYDALRTGEALGQFFAADEVVKFGISERLVGSDEVRAGLAEQTSTTTDWVVESHALRVTERTHYAWFSDRVTMGWTDTDRRIRYEFETRWSGTLERDARELSTTDAEATTSEAPTANSEEPWQFVGMHVSRAGEL